MLNEQMLKDGFASLLTIPPSVKYVDNFEKQQRFSKISIPVECNFECAIFCYL